MKLKIERINVSEFIRNLMDSYRELAEARQIDFELITDKEYTSVLIDKDCLDKIFFNLLSNAFKFTPHNGKITVEMKTKDDNNLIISVQDTGIGIPKEQQKYIFDRFYQVQDENNSAKTGTGIGLHLSKMMAELHHGSLQVESQKDIGSKFIITIPLNEDVYRLDEIEFINPKNPENNYQTSIHTSVEEQIDEIFKEKNSEKTDNKRKNALTVLIVEDDTLALDYMEQELKLFYKIYTAKNGKEGLAKTFHYLPDVIVSDVIMPEMDGLTMCKLIKKNEKTCHIPIILLTANSSAEQQIEGVEKGADSYIAKPFNIKYLQTRIEKLIQLRKTLEQKYSGKLEVNKDDIKVVTFDDKLLERINEKLKEHVTNPDLGVDIICKELGISRTHLNRKLKTITKESPSDYIRAYRLKHAAWLLLNKNMSISEIAYTLGYGTQSSFSIVFKKFYGMTPTEYIEAHKKDEAQDLEQNA